MNTREKCRVDGCDRPSDLIVCKTCARGLETDLADTSPLVDELETVLARQYVYGGRSGTRTSRSTPLVFDVRASNRIADLEAVLGAAARAVGLTASSSPNVMHAAQRVRRLAIVLMLRVPELRNHFDGAQHVEAIRRAYGRARSTVDRPADRWYAGPCWVCTRDLYARVGAPVVTCECRSSYDVQTRRDYLLGEAEDQLANAATIARAVSWLGAEPLTAARVRKWAERGRIIARAYDRCPTHLHDVIPPSSCRACSPLYRVGDAIDLLAADTNRKEPVS